MMSNFSILKEVLKNNQKSSKSLYLYEMNELKFALILCLSDETIFCLK